MVTDALVLGLFGAAPLVLAAVGFSLIYDLSGFINVAYGENSIIDDLHARVRTGVLPSATTGTKCNRLSIKSGGAHRLLREGGR